MRPSRPRDQRLGQEVGAEGRRDALDPLLVEGDRQGPKRSVLYRLVRSTSFSGLAGPTVMIVWPPQIADWISGW